MLKDTTQWRRWGSNPWPFGLESSTLPLSHCAPSYLSKVGTRGLLIWKIKYLDHQNWENLIRYKSKAVTHLLLKKNFHKNVNENMFSFTYLCKSSCICNVAKFVRIFMIFHQNVELRNLEWYVPFWEDFVYF